MTHRAVLVTGASSGIGFETALLLAERGYEVYATMRDLSRSTRLVDEAGRRNVRVRLLRLDATDADTIAEAVAAVIDRSGHLFALVNNAGVILRGYFEDLDDHEIRQVFETNLFGAMTVVRAVLPHMRQAGSGRIVIISSTGGRLATPGNVAYCSSKFALEGFGECLRQEVEPFGIEVKMIEPGFVKTELFGRNRNVARRVTDSGSPYHAFFQRLELLTDRELRKAATSPRAVADVVAKTLSTRRRRFRYVVGRRARFLFALRRCLPGEMFDRIWAHQIAKRLTAQEPDRP